jgi:tetratricopeptide (TPR) repeat protein
MLDFNYGEVIPLQDTLAKAGYPHWLRIFDGAHEWPPGEVMEDALAWFRIQAMKAQREPRDPAFLAAQFSKMVDRAKSFEQSGDSLAAWREYAQLAATFDAFRDVSALRSKADSLGREKAVRDALKREQSEFAEQAQLTSQITSRFDSSNEGGDDRFEADREMRDQLDRLRGNAEHEKRPERARVYKRALAGVFIGAMEQGNSALDRKTFGSAARLYDAATQAKPDSEWAWRQLAVAYALGGKKKDAFTALRKAHDLTPDRAAFGKWFANESAFDDFRALADFRQFAKSD